MTGYALALAGLYAVASMLTVAAMALQLALQARRSRGAQVPPSVPGVSTATWSDAVRLVSWARHGYAHGARKVSEQWSTRAASAVLWCGSVILWPAIVAIQALLLARPWVTYYANANAVLAIAAYRDGWYLEDHVSAAPGTGQGTALQDELLDRLLAAADEHHITVRTTAAHPLLAERYMQRIPFRDDGPARPRGRRLVYEPKGVSVPTPNVPGA